VEISGIVSQLTQRSIVTVSEDELQMLLEMGESVREKDTCLSGKIRILRIDDMVVVQEKIPQGAYLIRKMESREEADRFVDERLETYDRMWDGCGCKIDYFSKS